MKKRKMLCLALVLSIVGLYAAPVMFAESAKNAPVMTTRAGLHQNLVFYGSSVARIVRTTAPQLLVTGEGFLDAICPLGGDAGGYSLAFDSALSASVGLDSMSLAISRNAWVRLDSTQSDDSGCWVPKWGPIRFVRGLVGVQSSASGVTLFYVHESDGANPGQAEVTKP